VTKTQITQVLTNIAKNAAESILSKYINNEELGEIKFFLKQVQDNALEISIEDNGKGIEQELIHKITEPYITTKTSGMGLGLSIVKKILEDHDSQLHISNIKDGVKVSFNLKIGNKNE
jgi:two-component system, NtrC family, nitrogen regulation sensor histidine kinase NtrY